MKTFPLILVVMTIMAGCHQRNPVIDSTNQPENRDSVEQILLLKAVYQWHDKTQNPVDFQVIVKDSFQTGLNYDSFNITFNALKQSNYFSATFIDNYRKIADYVNKKLTSAHPRYLNEINFSFQDADPWTGFQDEAPDYWNQFKIHDYKPAPDSASLKWTISDSTSTSAPYEVHFEKEKGQWKVSYLQGFDERTISQQ
jgi:hypothetical protein